MSLPSSVREVFAIGVVNFWISSSSLLDEERLELEDTWFLYLCHGPGQHHQLELILTGRLLILNLSTQCGQSSPQFLMSSLMFLSLRIWTICLN